MKGIEGVSTGKSRGDGDEPRNRNRRPRYEDRAAGCGTGLFVSGFRPMSVRLRQEMIDLGHADVTILRQCQLVAISPLAWYGSANGENALNLSLMRLIDAQFLEMP